MRYVILTAPNNGDVGGALYLQVSFLVRLLVYLLLLGFSVMIFYLILKYLGVYDGDDRNTNVVEDTYTASDVIAAHSETQPLMHAEPNRCSYGTIEEFDEESGAYSSSSEELYDEKLCVICYDEQRNSFFVPCGHCATCYDCAERIVHGEIKLCPICRRLIHRVRRLFHS